MTVRPPDLRRCAGRALSLPTLFAVVWIWILWWGERAVFVRSLKVCHWDRWEQWVRLHALSIRSALTARQSLAANPHHVVLIADPQIVDPHTYPGRPWPLSSLTEWSTDLYLHRSYRLLQQYLEPDTIFFLGDLFDGGREWATKTTSSPDARYKKYDNQFWLKEYRRFVNLFLNPQSLGNTKSPNPRGRKIVSSLPGNHDLGFAGGIQLAVKQRFDAYFGPLNRIDVVGNHTFVSIDTVSLSAMDQVDPTTGSSGLGDGTAASSGSGEIWRPVNEFLREAQESRNSAIHQEVLGMLRTSDSTYSQGPYDTYVGNVTSLVDAFPIVKKQTPVRSVFFPSVILSHVPFFRPADTDCGPFRESSRALSISRGYQYQNVLTPLISKDIISHLNAAEIAQIYSGDDHDYCEIEHVEFTGRIKEITVKSMSWAMGVRRPGFLAVSLYNPVNLDDLSVATDEAEVHSMPKDTIQNHLCLLPDQLAIFLRYAQLLGLTILVLAIRAAFYKPTPEHHKSSGIASISLLPVSRDNSVNDEPYYEHQHHIPSHASSTSATASSTHPTHHLSTRSNGLAPGATGPLRPSSPSKFGGYGNVPASSRSSSPAKNLDAFPPPRRGNHVSSSQDWSTRPRQPHRRPWAGPRWLEFTRSMTQVAVPAVLWFFWLIWNG